MRAPSKSIQHSSMPSPNGGTPLARLFEVAIIQLRGPSKIFPCGDNYFPYAAFYVNETTPLSLHFGELRLPVFMRLASHPITTKRCHPERSSHFAKRNDVESKDPVSAGKRTQRRNEFSPRLTRLFSSSPTASSAPEFLCRHASLPIGTEAGSALRCPACY